jgi:hypothetical protein
VGVSFSIPVALAEGERGTAIFLKVGESKKEGCEGSAEAPTAPPGKLCVYAHEENAVHIYASRPISFAGAQGFGSPGAVLYFLGNGGTETEPGEIRADGSWAVTAPVAAS